MGAIGSKQEQSTHAHGSSKKYSKNDYELAIKASKELECMLEEEFHASGRGLHEKITSAGTNELEPYLIRKLRYIATIRNKLIHDIRFDTIPDRERFISEYEESKKELRMIVQKRKKYEGKVVRTLLDKNPGCIIC